MSFRLVPTAGKAAAMAATLALTALLTPSLAQTPAPVPPAVTPAAPPSDATPAQPGDAFGEDAALTAKTDHLHQGQRHLG